MFIYIWFFICMGIIVGMIPLHFISVEHKKFEEKYGKEKGNKINRAAAMASGWGFFMVLFLGWILPQRFNTALDHHHILQLQYIHNVLAESCLLTHGFHQG